MQRMDEVAGDFGAAGQPRDQVPAEASVEVRGSHELLSAIMSARIDGDAEATFGDLLQAFAQARDYRDYAKALTVYLQFRAFFPDEQIPCGIHRDAGFVAASCRQPQVASAAFAAALGGGLEEGVRRVWQTAEALLRGVLERPDLADQAREVLEALPAESGAGVPA